jgi:chromatin remodeling complex protein RSC6
MSGLTKKIICADKTLGTILGVNEGALVSYSELMKGLHRYIKEKNLKNPQSVAKFTTTVPVVATAIAPEVSRCRACGEPIPAAAVFCDLCGVKQ